MVKRYPHTAEVTIGIGGALVNGAWVEGTTETLTIVGRYDPVSDGRIVRATNAQGDEKQVHGYFYSGYRPSIGMDYQRLKVPAMGIDVDIICWEPYQSHSVICV